MNRYDPLKDDTHGAVKDLDTSQAEQEKTTAVMNRYDPPKDDTPGAGKDLDTNQAEQENRNTAVMNRYDRPKDDTPGEGSDLDSNQAEQEKDRARAQSTNLKQQGVGSPVINEVVCHEQEIRVSWSPARGAKKHTLKVDGLDEELTHDLKAENLDFTFNVTNPHHYGKMCTFTIEAAGDAEEAIRSNSKRALIGGDLVTDVVAKTCEECPGRMILVTWKKPKLDPQGYYLQLMEAKNNKQADEVNPLESTKSSHKFVRLKSSTRYQCEVFPIYEGKKGIGSLSNLVTTTKFTRTEGFDIEEHGKPKITACSAVPSNGGKGLLSQFAWMMPELGVEEDNYNVVDIQAVIAINGKEQMLTVETGNKAQPVPLMFGATYLFSVKCVYLDLDKHVEFNAMSKLILHTDIGTPVLNKVTCNRQEVTVSWSPAGGATKHVLVVDGLDERLTENMKKKNLNYNFKIKNPRYYGKMCTLTMEATGGVDKTSKSISKQALIGGDVAVTDVVAEICHECPGRNVLVKWKSPKQEPQRYSLQLYEIKDGTNEKVDEAVAQKQTQLVHRFVELKTSTSYYCVVIPIYKGKKEIGSISNIVTTAKRVDNAFEKNDDFGTPGEIFSLIKKTSDSDGCLVELSWKMKDIGENFKLSRYKLVVNRSTVLDKVTDQFPYVTRFFNTYEERLLSNSTKAEIPKLEMGFKYNAKLTSTLIDLDTGKESNKTKEHQFATEPSKTKINDCESKDGLVTFSWEPVDGAQEYKLIMKDELLSELVADDSIVAGDKCEVEVQATEKLCVGRTCMTKVIVSVNEMTSESDWKAHLIGGNHVPRNVKASRNSGDSKRSILVTFDSPKNGPADQYKIVAIPEYGKRKTSYCKNSPLLIKYLRKGVKYKFKVHAKQGEKWSEIGSPSNFQKTDGVDENTPPVNFSNIKGKVYAPKSSFYGRTTNINIVKGDSFGKVRDLLPTLCPHERNEVDNLTLSWKVPSFGNNAPDYKVEKYKVEIRKKDTPKCNEFLVEFLEGLDTYSIATQELDLDEMYEISVSTLYTDIDQDQEYRSSAEKATRQTRPCKPNGVKHQVVKIANDEEALKIEWNAAKSADQYEVELYTDESGPNPLYKALTKNDTKWSRTFEEGFGYGTSFYAVVTAVKENKRNSFKTDRDTIGGDLSPRKVHAICDQDKVDDPNTQVLLSWMQPPKVPESYEISYENSGKREQIPCKETECLINKLKAGDYYTFKVVAIFEKNRSGGCLSNKIQTNPTPTQVKNVSTSPGDNPSTSIKIYWDKVEAEKKDELTAYRVTISSKATSREIENVAEDYLFVYGLEPDTEYSTTVAGGNSIGFGKDSESVSFKTDRGTPKDVELLNHIYKDMQSTSLSLKFTGAEGGPLKHVGSLYKRQNENLFQADVEVKSGHIFTDLEPNTEYFAKVHAVFEGEKQGEDEKSGAILTAPSKPEIYEYHCCIENKMNSSKDMMLKWKSDSGCTEHEIKIKHGDEIESLLTVNNRNDLRYSCQHEASRYTARVRTKNILFGPWSDEAVIVLAPRKTNINVKLEKEGSNIIIQCNKAASGCFTYICQPFCDTEAVVEPTKVQPKEADDIVKFIFEPTQHAEKYHFELWAEDDNGLKGESSISENVISRPDLAKIEKAERTQENPSMDITISWEALDRCDGYEVKIKKNGQKKRESIVRTNEETICTYRCQCPGSIYDVRVRGICSSVHGCWSEKKSVALAPADVELIQDRNEQEPVETVQVKWKELEPVPESYHVVLYQGNDKLDEQTVKTERKENDPGPILNEHVFKGVGKPGLLHYCTVAAHNHGVSGRPIKTKSYRKKWNTPEKLLITHDNNYPSKIAKIFWEKPDGVNCFRLEIEDNQLGSKISLILDKNNHVFESGKPGTSYTVRLYCGCDDFYTSGYVWTTMTMKPDPPTNMKAVANRDVNGIIVTYKDSCCQPKTYEVCAKPLAREGENEDPTVVPTKEERAVLKNLVPGESYEVSVTAMCKNERSTTVTLDDYVLTYPAEVKNLEYSNSENDALVYKWDALTIPPDEYIVQWKVNNEPITKESTKETEFKIHFLKPAHFYSLRVRALNRAGKGKVSDWKIFQTAPSMPVNLRYKIFNTSELEISCDSCHGANKYIFKINGINYESQTPIYRCDNCDNVLIKVQIYSSNEAGMSEMSEVLEFRQTLNFLRKEFLHIAENIIKKDSFIMPALREILGGDKFESDDLQMLEGQTVIIRGGHFTGKTSFCGYFLQKLDNSKLGIYMDYDKIKNIGGKHKFKSLLQKFMTNVTPEEMDFLIEWMKKNSEDVVFVVDNFEVNKNYVEKQLSYDDKEAPIYVLQAVLKSNRELFANSQVLCTTSQTSLQQMLNAKKTWEITGLCPEDVEKMRYKRSPSVEIPPHLGFFCKVPNYCEIILRLLETPHTTDVDVSSCSSVLVELLAKSLDRYTENGRKEKLRQIIEGIKRVPDKLKIDSKGQEKVKIRKMRSGQAASPECSDIQLHRELLMRGDDAADNKSCKVLYDCIEAALYYALFSPLKEFEKHFQKKFINQESNSLTWIVASGLLRKETMEKAIALVFNNENINKDEVQEKFASLSKFIKHNMESIWKLVYSKPLVVLDWLSCCNELNEEDLLKSCYGKICITEKTTKDEVQEAAKFVKYIPQRFCEIIRIKITTKEVTKTKAIDKAIEENTYGEFIKLNTETSTKGPLSRKQWRYESLRDKAKSSAIDVKVEHNESPAEAIVIEESTSSEKETEPCILLIQKERVMRISMDDDPSRDLKPGTAE